MDVWECNGDAVDAFQLCPLAGIGHMGGIHWQGIEPASALSACQALQLPADLWKGLVQDVVYMGRVVADARNRREARK